MCVYIWAVGSVVARHLQDKHANFYLGFGVSF